MAALFPLLCILGLRLGLFLLCRALLLPLLFGEAQHASLESSPLNEAHELRGFAGYAQPGANASSSSLPAPATTTWHKPSTANGAANGAKSLLRRATKLELKADSGMVFSLSFEESASLFGFVLLEALGIDKRTLKSNWTFSLFTVLALAVLIIPFGICALFTVKSSGSKSHLRRLVWAVIPFVAWLVLFFRVPLPAAMSGASTGHLDAMLARTAVLGVTLIGLLSGGAAVVSAWDTYEAFFAKRKPRAPSASELRSAEESFHRTCSDLASRRAELQALRDRPADGTETTGFMGRIWGGSQRDKDAKSLKAEISGLELVATAMRDDLDAMKTHARDAAWSKTFQGKILLGMGHLFSVYCVWRLLLAVFSLLILGYKDSVPPDFVTLGLAYVFRLFSLHVDLAMWSRQISLLFVGALISLRMRYVLSSLSSVFRAASSGSSASFLILFLAQVMTIYLLSTLIQLRTALPPAFSTPSASPDPSVPAPVAPLLSTLPSFTTVFGAVFDSSFLLAAAGTAVHRWITRDTLGGGPGALFGGGRDF